MTKCAKCGNGSFAFHSINSEMICEHCYKEIPEEEKQTLVKDFKERTKIDYGE